jgi:hypothetical protein
MSMAPLDYRDLRGEPGPRPIRLAVRRDYVGGESHPWALIDDAVAKIEENDYGLIAHGFDSVAAAIAYAMETYGPGVHVEVEQ